MKFTEAELTVTKALAAELQLKRAAFIRATGTKKAVLLTLVTTHGLRDTRHSRELALSVVTMDDLFER